jgi:hypothetical protein
MAIAYMSRCQLIGITPTTRSWDGNEDIQDFVSL